LSSHDDEYDNDSDKAKPCDQGTALWATVTAAFDQFFRSKTPRREYIPPRAGEKSGRIRDFGGQMPRFRGFEAEIEEIEAAIEAESFVLGAPVGPGVGANTRRRRRIVVDIPMHSNE
jgi:hypothetical protein